MSEQEQIDALKESNETWRKQWASERYEVEQLKAQLECALKLLDEISGFINTPEAHWEYCKELKKLKEKPEKCLAEVKANAIEEYKQEHNTKIGSSR